MVAVTLACSYLACWRPTSVAGVDDVKSVACEPEVYRSKVGTVTAHVIATASYGEEIQDVSPRFPLVVRVTENHLSELVYRDYFWFFGWVVELPFEHRIPADVGFESTD